MNKVVLKEEDLQFLLRWRDEHKDLVRLCVSPMKGVRIECVDSGYAITGIRDGSNLRLTVNEKGRSVGSLTFEILPNGLCKLVKNKTQLGQEDRQAVLTVYCSVMALLVFGNGTINEPTVDTKKNEGRPRKSKKAAKHNKRNGITYILSKRENEPQIMVQGSPHSPRCAFSVRGHYRHYKSGKVIWIAEYTKGGGKKKDKAYKIGRKGDR